MDNFSSDTAISIETLVESGAHFGHLASKWNPRMAPYILGVKNKIHIIDLAKTMESWRKCEAFLKQSAKEGAQFIFVGTKRQAQEIIKDVAERVGPPSAFYVNKRWLGGLLTNFKTVKQALQKMDEREERLTRNKESIEKSGIELMKKKEAGQEQKLLDKRVIALGGLRKLRVLKENTVIIVVDVNKEHNAIQEARCRGFSIVAMVDTNTDPNLVDYPIPCNDDATRAIQLVMNACANAILEGKTGAPATAAANKEAADAAQARAMQEKGEAN